ncbi:MAG: hypothetical protein AAF656_09980, partial [Planctomycetota bacterium]
MRFPTACRPTAFPGLAAAASTVLISASAAHAGGTILAIQDFDTGFGDSALATYAATDELALDLGDVIALPNTDDMGDTVFLNGVEAFPELGFASTFTNNFDNADGINGDLVGVTNRTSPPAPGGDRPAGFDTGAFGFGITDPDGTLAVTFDPVNVDGFENIQLSIALFISNTTYETSDRFAVTASDASSTVTLFELVGDPVDLDDPLESFAADSAAEIATGGDGFIPLFLDVDGLTGDITFTVSFAAGGETEA